MDTLSYDTGDPDDEADTGGGSGCNDAADCCVNDVTGSCIDTERGGSCIQGRIQDFLKGESESGVDIEGGANSSIVSLKQGVWGRSPPEAMGYLIWIVLKSQKMQDCSVFKLNL